MDAKTRDQLRQLVKQQRKVQRRMFAAQSAAIAALQQAVEAISLMHADMLPLYETLNDLDDTIEGTDSETGE